MELKYTEEELNSLDKEMLIRLFLLQQKELEKYRPYASIGIGAGGGLKEAPLRQVIGGA